MDRLLVLARMLVIVGSVLAVTSFFLIITGPETARIARRAITAATHSRWHAANGKNQSLANAKLDFLLDDNNPLPSIIQSFIDQEPVNEDVSTHSMRLEVDESQLELQIYNAYTRSSPLQTGHYSYPWRYIAEPYRPTTLSAVNGRADAWYKWIVDGHTQAYGVDVDVLWTSTGWKYVVLVENVNGNNTCVLAAKVMVKYVRREIRSLTDRDRETFFQAAMIMQRVPTEVGERLFGNKYRSKDYFNRLHLYYGGMGDCDHWHQGAGFVTSHMALTLQYEQSLQSIYPDVPVPYWDFTIESTFYDPSTWRTSLVFADDWFGDASPNNELHTVTQGRWAYVPTMTHAWNFSDVINSYGLLRAPWNNDPTPYLTRHSEIYGSSSSLR